MLLRKTMWLMMLILIVLFVFGLVFPEMGARYARAEDGLTLTGNPQPADPACPPGSKFSPFPIKDYRGDIWLRPNILGNWGGARNELAEKGITLELWATQVLQGNARGGADTDRGFRYSGSLDYWLWLDTGRMGLWEGSQWTFHGETQLGHSINGKVGSILGPNYDALLPNPDRQKSALSEYYITQFFGSSLSVIFGQIDPLNFADTNRFANNERTQFLNTGLRSNPVLFMFEPYTARTLAIALSPADWLTITTAILDTNGSATRSGYTTWWSDSTGRGTTITQEWDFNVNLFGQTGTQRGGIAYSNKRFHEPELDMRINIPALKETGERPDDWCLYYNFDQYLYTESEDPSQGLGIFGRFGWSTGESNPVQRFYSIGIGGKGVLPCRDQDTLGVGYTYTDLSSDVMQGLDISNEQAIELFYNIEVTKSISLTPDLQFIVNPGGGYEDRKTSVVYGLRAQMEF